MSGGVKGHTGGSLPHGCRWRWTGGVLAEDCCSTFSPPLADLSGFNNKHVSVHQSGLIQTQEPGTRTKTIYNRRWFYLILKFVKGLKPKGPRSKHNDSLNKYDSDKKEK